MRRRLVMIAVVLGFVVVAQALILSREFMYYAAHRYYHWRSGRGWHCEQCRTRSHEFTLPLHTYESVRDSTGQVVATIVGPPPPRPKPTPKPATPNITRGWPWP